MKRSLSSRSLNNTVERGSAKRQKQYTTRHISWEEQRSLGGVFAAVGEGSWPVLRIIDQRGSGKRRYYLIEWHPHPNTHEEFEPEWKPYTDVSRDSITEWKETQNYSKIKAAGPTSAAHSTAASRPRQRPVIHDSSSQSAPQVDQESDAAASPPGLESGSSASGIEIAETQYFAEPLRIKLPPLPLDKDDYETVRSSQAVPSSPDTRITIASSHSPVSSKPLTESSRSQSHPQSNRATKLRQHKTSSPIASEFSSPSVSSRPQRTRQKSSTKLAQALQPTQSPIRETPASIAFDFATQLPFVISESGSSPTPVQPSSRSTEGTRSRLKSPFQESSPESTRLSAHQITREPEYRIATPLARKLKGRKTSSRGLESAARMPDSLIEELNTLSPSSAMASPKPDLPLQDPSASHVKSPLQNSISADEIASAEPLFADSNTDGLIVPIDSSSQAHMIHASIEDEPQSSTEISDLVDSKVSSSQESLNQEREIETIDGLMIPTYPIFADYEHAIALPAEGKVKSAYEEIIKLKKKSILSFIGRKGSPGTAGISKKRTDQRNEMLSLLQRLNDTTTHTDLGLDPSQNEYSLKSEEYAAYSEYAGSKFTILGSMLDALKHSKSSIVIFAQQGSLQGLLTEYLAMKHVKVRCWDQPATIEGDETEQFTVHLLAAPSDKPVVLNQKPLFVIAFDLSFTTTDARFQSMRRQFEDLRVIHFLITNSAEHADRCVPISYPSNVRLKVVIQTAYLAAPNLGGDITWVRHASDEPPDGRPMDLADIQRSVRKSPNRRLVWLAYIIVSNALAGRIAEPETWELTDMPELKLEQLSTSPKISRAASRTPQPRSSRNRTPMSRGTTPMGRKRHLDPEGDNGSKRQRFTPIQDLGLESRQSPVPGGEDLQEARRQIAQLNIELSTARSAASAAEEKQAATDEILQSWRDDHAELLKRFEHGKAKQAQMFKENKKLTSTLATLKERDETLREEKLSLRQQITELKSELTKTREELKSSGTEAGHLETAREEARTAMAKMATLEKSLKTTKSDFEFTRTQYQDASKRAADLALELRDFEEQVEKLKMAAGDSKRQLKAMNYEASINKFMAKAEQFKLEVKSREVLIKKLTEENNSLKTRRGVQTRGSSVQPNPSPAPRSRQNSPAPGRSPAPTHLMPPVPSGSRASVLRNER